MAYEQQRSSDFAHLLAGSRFGADYDDSFKKKTDYLRRDVPDR